MKTSPCYSAASVYITSFTIFLLLLVFFIPERILAESSNSGAVTTRVIGQSCIVISGVTVAAWSPGAGAVGIAVNGTNGTCDFVFHELGNFMVSGADTERCSIVGQADGAEALSGNFVNSTHFSYQGGMDRCIRLAASAHCITFLPSY